MRGFLTALWALPVAVIAVLLSVANRAAVTFSLDPFTRGGPPQLAFEVPLYALLFAALALGVMVGGIMAWLAQGRHRREKRRHRRDAEQVRAEADRLRARVVEGRASAVTALPAPGRA